MSWGAYIQTLETGKGRCQYAAIVGRNPVSVWSESPDKSTFPITIEDITFLIKTIVSQDFSVMSTGLKIGGKVPFTCLLLEPDLLICQGKGENKDYSLVIALTIQAVIIGFCPYIEVKTTTLRDCMEKLQEYLKTAGY